MLDPSRESAGRAPFRATDSPWFWACAFSLMALVGIAAIAPKFERRQARLEGRHAAREQIAAERGRRGAGLPPADFDADAREPDAAPARIVPLWPLALVAGVVAAVSGAVVMRDARRAGRPVRQPMIERRREM